MTPTQKRGRVFLLLAFMGVLVFACTASWFRYTLGQASWIDPIGFLCMVVTCWQVWNGWKPAYVGLCAVTLIGVIAGALAAPHMVLRALVTGMTGLSFLCLVRLETLEFLSLQRKKRSSAAAATSRSS